MVIASERFPQTAEDIERQFADPPSATGAPPPPPQPAPKPAPAPKAEDPTPPPPAPAPAGDEPSPGDGAPAAGTEGNSEPADGAPASGAVLDKLDSKTADAMWELYGDQLLEAKQGKERVQKTAAQLSDRQVAAMRVDPTYDDEYAGLTEQFRQTQSVAERELTRASQMLAAAAEDPTKVPVRDLAASTTQAITAALQSTGMARDIASREHFRALTGAAENILAPYNDVVFTDDKGEPMKVGEENYTVGHAWDFAQEERERGLQEYRRFANAGDEKNRAKAPQVKSQVEARFAERLFNLALIVGERRGLQQRGQKASAEDQARETLKNDMNVREAMARVSAGLPAAPAGGSGGRARNFTAEEIDAMSDEEYDKNRAAIFAQQSAAVVRS